LPIHATWPAQLSCLLPYVRSAPLPISSDSSTTALPGPCISLAAASELILGSKRNHSSVRCSERPEAPGGRLSYKGRVAELSGEWNA
jgi:hypothetical protein